MLRRASPGARGQGQSDGVSGPRRSDAWTRLLPSSPSRRSRWHGVRSRPVGCSGGNQPGCPAKGGLFWAGRQWRKYSTSAGLESGAGPGPNPGRGRRVLSYAGMLRARETRCAPRPAQGGRRGHRSHPAGPDATTAGTLLGRARAAAAQGRAAGALQRWKGVHCLLACWELIISIPCLSRCGDARFQALTADLQRRRA